MCHTKCEAILISSEILYVRLKSRLIFRIKECVSIYAFKNSAMQFFIPSGVASEILLRVLLICPLAAVRFIVKLAFSISIFNANEKSLDSQMAGVMVQTALSGKQFTISAVTGCAGDWWGSAHQSWQLYMKLIQSFVGKSMEKQKIIFLILYRGCWHII